MVADLDYATARGHLPARIVALLDGKAEHRRTAACNEPTRAMVGWWRVHPGLKFVATLRINTLAGYASTAGAANDYELRNYHRQERNVPGNAVGREGQLHTVRTCTRTARAIVARREV
jgi:hypothetical protein